MMVKAIVLSNYVLNNIKEVKAMKERYIKITVGELVIEIKGNFVTTTKQNGEFVALPVQIQQEEKVPHFFKMTSEKRKKVKRWLKNEKKELAHKTDREKTFLETLEEGLKTVKYEYRISTIEPTMNKETEKIEFIKGAEVARGYSCEQWKKFAEEFMPERGSRLANLYELFIWYAWRIVKGYWTLSYVANDSSSDGNYANSPNAAGEYEVSAKRKVGGFRDGIGNTCKIVTHGVRYALVGGDYGSIGGNCPVGDVVYHDHPNLAQYNSSGVFVLTK